MLLRSRGFDMNTGRFDGKIRRVFKQAGDSSSHGGSGVDQFGRLRDTAPNRRSQEGVVGAAEYQHVGSRLEQGADGFIDGELGFGSVGDSLLDQLHKPRAGARDDAHSTCVCVHELVKLLSCDRGFGREDSDDPAPGDLGSRFDGRFHPDNGDGVGRAKRSDCVNRGRVAGDDEDLRASFQEVVGDRRDSVTDLFSWLVAVRAPGRVCYVMNRDLREEGMNFPKDGKTTDARIQYPDFHTERSVFGFAGPPEGLGIGGGLSEVILGGQLDVDHLLLGIEILIELGFGDGFGNHARLGHLHATGPDDGVEDDPAKVIDCPVAVPMSAGESDPTSAIGSFHGPHHGLLLAKSLLSSGSPVDVAIDSLACGNSGQDAAGGVGIGKTDVVVPLVVGGKTGNSIADGVVFVDLDFCGPVRIGRESSFVVAADPLFEIFTLGALRNLNPVVHAHEADSGFEERVQFFFVAIHGVFRISIRVNDDGHGSFKDCFIFGPAIVNHLDPHGKVALLIESTGEKNGSCVEFVLTRRVAWLTGDEDNFSRALYRRRGVVCVLARCGENGDSADGYSSTDRNRKRGESIPKKGERILHDENMKVTGPQCQSFCKALFWVTAVYALCRN